MDNLLEDDIKNSILHLQSIFPKNKLGKSLVTYEKTINFKTIADCLIFTEKQGIIGIEIKTAHDTLKRLSHQLDDYVQCCSYVYVYCHDSHLDEVTKLLSKKQLNYVGIISYTEFNHKAIAGVIKRAKLSPALTSKGNTSLLWTSELKKIICKVEHDSAKYNRRELDNKFRSYFSVAKGNQLVSSFYLDGLTDSQKPLQRFYFGKTYVHDRTIDHSSYQQIPRRYRKLAYRNRRYYAKR